jgi:hypothetical protein
VASNVVGRSYGARYAETLYDRPIKGIEQRDGYVFIEWYNADPTSFVELVYEDAANEKHTRYVPATSDTSMLIGCKPASLIQMQTCYLPDVFAVDTFRVGAQPRFINADADFTTTYINNSGAGGIGITGITVEGNFGD